MQKHDLQFHILNQLKNALSKGEIMPVLCFNTTLKQHGRYTLSQDGRIQQGPNLLDEAYAAHDQS